MSKAVLISIRPQWVEKIASGIKTIEIRRTAPKLQTPFKCYIYCTKAGDYLCRKTDGTIWKAKHGSFIMPIDSVEWTGKVACQFV